MQKRKKHPNHCTVYSELYNDVKAASFNSFLYMKLYNGNRSSEISRVESVAPKNVLPFD